MLIDSGKNEKEISYDDFLVRNQSRKPSQTVEIGRDTEATYELYYIGDTYNITNVDEVSVEIPNGDNYVRSITVSGYKAGYTPKAGVAVTADNINFTVAYAEDVVEGDTEWTASASTVHFITSATPEAGKSFAPSIYYTYTTNEGAKVGYYTFNSVAIPAAEDPNT